MDNPFQLDEFTTVEVRDVHNPDEQGKFVYVTDKSAGLELVIYPFTLMDMRNICSPAMNGEVTKFFNHFIMRTKGVYKMTWDKDNKLIGCDELQIYEIDMEDYASLIKSFLRWYGRIAGGVR